MKHSNWPIYVLLLLSLLLFWCTAYDPCAEYDNGTDMYFECSTGEEIDLTPVKDIEV